MEKKIVKFKVTDYDVLDDTELLIQAYRYHGKLETLNKIGYKDINAVNELFGIILNFKLIYTEAFRRFGKFTGDEDGLDKLLRDNGIDL